MHNVHILKNIDWDDKLKVYYQYKKERGLANMLHIRIDKIQNFTQPSTEDTARKSILKQRTCTPIMTERFHTTSPFEHSRSSRIRTQFASPKKVKTQRSTQNSPRAHPFCEQSPMQTYLNKVDVTPSDKLIMRRFINNQWVKDVIQKKTICIPRSPNQQLRVKKGSQFKKKVTNPKQQNMITLKIKIFAKLAREQGITIRESIAQWKSSTYLILFMMYLRLETFSQCDKLLGQHPWLINTPNQQGERPIHNCIIRNSLKQIVYLLQQRTIDKEALNFRDQTPLQLAIELKMYDSQIVLLNSFVSPWRIIEQNSLLKCAISYRIQLICIKASMESCETQDQFEQRVLGQQTRELHAIRQTL